MAKCPSCNETIINLNTLTPIRTTIKGTNFSMEAIVIMCPHSNCKAVLSVIADPFVVNEGIVKLLNTFELRLKGG